VINAALRLIDEDDRFRAGIRKGIEEADRGDLVDEVEMDSRFELTFAQPLLVPALESRNYAGDWSFLVWLGAALS
jgi:hypothetical protein